MKAGSGGQEGVAGPLHSGDQSTTLGDLDRSPGRMDAQIAEGPLGRFAVIGAFDVSDRRIAVGSSVKVKSVQPHIPAVRRAEQRVCPTADFHYELEIRTRPRRC